MKPTDLSDVEYFKEKLRIAFGIPKEFLDSSGANTNETQLIKSIQRYAREFKQIIPDEIGWYINDPTKLVSVHVTCIGRIHGSDDEYEVIIKDSNGNQIKKFREIYSIVPSFIVGGKSYYKG